MGSFEKTWRDEIRDKLITTFEDNLEVLTRILYYLDEEERAYSDPTLITPAWRTLKSALKSKVFKNYAMQLAEDTRKAEVDVRYRKFMNLVYSQMVEPSDEPLPSDQHQSWDVARLADMDKVTASGVMGFLHSWSLIPIPSQRKILEILPQIVGNRQLLQSVDEVVSLVNQRGGNVVMIALATLQLGYDAIVNLSRWWRGEITGLRCCKNIVDSFVTIGAGIAGGFGGAAIGSFVGPVGTLIGGIAGGIAASQATNFLVDRLTQSIFGIPKEESLEKAYNYFGVKMSAPNDEINSSFRKLCLKHHPDKGGNPDDFLVVQLNMGIIRLARGESM